MNKEVKEFCETYGLTVEQFYGREVYKGFLFLNSLKELPEGFNPIVGGSLDLRKVTKLPKGFNPTVGGYLDLSHVKELPQGFNPTVGGSLDLREVTKLPKGFNPTVGGYFDLRSLTELPEGFNPTVGGSLDLNSVKQLPEWYTTPKVGYRIFLKGYKDVFVNNAKETDFLSWKDGKYIKADCIFTEVVSHKGNVWKVKRLDEDKIFYLITDGNENYSHGNTLKEAKADLIYKITNRSKDDYKDLTLDSELTYEESIVCYRVITGACSFGTRDYIQNRLPKRKETYTIAEIIELTNGEYGNNTFESFFTK